MSKNKSISAHHKFLLFSNKAIIICFSIIFATILITLLCFSWFQYYGSKNFTLPNIVSLLIGLSFGILAYLLLRKTHFFLNPRKPQIIIFSIFFIAFIIQLIIIIFGYFYTAWDAGYINTLADSVTNTGSLPLEDHYLSIYPNNIFIVFILSLLKSVPFFGHHYLFLLGFNALLVNLAGLFTCLTICKLTSPKTAILSNLITIPLILLSPWIIIPYSDTMAIIFPILTFYIYLTMRSNYKYAIITFLSIIGYYIKPTCIIVLIAIIFIEFIHHKPKRNTYSIKNPQFVKTAISIPFTLLLCFCIKQFSINYIDFHQASDAKPVNFVHYLAMGQNDQNSGVYLEEDIEDAKYGTLFEFKKFLRRITNRTPIEQAKFFGSKLLVNYNDGTFAWSFEGNFYSNIPDRDSPISNFLANLYYRGGAYYNVFIQTEQIIWIFVIFGCAFLFYKHASKEATIIGLSLIGIFLFVMLFEARARYLYCYSPFFVTAAAIGFPNFINFIKSTRSNIAAKRLAKSAKH